MSDKDPSPIPEASASQPRSRSNSIVETSQPNVPNEKRVLRIVPRTKTVQSRRVKRTVQSVEVTVDTIRNLSSYSEVAAAASLGISVTALKHACRTLGFEKWPRQATEYFELDANKGKGRAAGGSGESAASVKSEPKSDPKRAASGLSPKDKSKRQQVPAGQTLELAALSMAEGDVSDDSAGALSEPFELNDSTQSTDLHTSSFRDAPVGHDNIFATTAARSSLHSDEKWSGFQSKPVVQVAEEAPRERPVHPQLLDAISPSSFTFPVSNSALWGQQDPMELSATEQSQQGAETQPTSELFTFHRVTSAYIEPPSMTETHSSNWLDSRQSCGDGWSPPKFTMQQAAAELQFLDATGGPAEAPQMDAGGEMDLERHIFLHARLARQQRLWNLQKDDCL